MFTILEKRLKRNQFEIFSAILQFAKENRKKTNIMHHCNLGTESGKEVIDLLVRNGLLAKRNDFYSTTEKGVEFVQKFLDLEKFLNTPAAAN